MDFLFGKEENFKGLLWVLLSQGDHWLFTVSYLSIFSQRCLLNSYIRPFWKTSIGRLNWLIWSTGTKNFFKKRNTYLELKSISPRSRKVLIIIQASDTVKNFSQAMPLTKFISFKTYCNVTEDFQWLDSNTTTLKKFYLFTFSSQTKIPNSNEVHIHILYTIYI